MKVLVVAPQPFFSPRGTPLSVYQRTRVAAELGADIDFLTYGEGADVDLPGVRFVRIPRVRWLEPVPVGPSFAKACLDVLLAVWMVALLLRRRYDVVHAHEEGVFLATCLKPFFRFKLIYDMHSSLPQQLANFSFTRSRFLIGLFERLEHAALRASDAVITISPALAEYAVAQIGGEERHVLIENSLLEPVRLAGAGDVAAGGAPPRLPEGVPVVAYAGTFEAYQGIDLLLEAHARVLRSVPDAILLLVGGAPAKVEEERSRARALGIEAACVFTGYLPQERARAIVAGATLVVSPRTRGVNTPLKVYEQLACGIPLVATRVPAHTQVLTEEVCFLADPDAESLASALVLALQDAHRRAAVVRAAQALYRGRYAPDRYEERMRHVLALVTR
jgi:glycosyltransferase involved in cell wall biosynthesis